jgi:hypothetical protein
LLPIDIREIGPNDTGSGRQVGYVALHRLVTGRGCPDREGQDAEKKGKRGPGGTLEVMERYVIDTNIHDLIADTPGANALVQRLVAAGRIELIVTHLQQDELSNASPARRQKLREIPTTQVPTADFILGVSRLDHARLGDGQVLEAVRGTPTHTIDGEIAATAALEGAWLVTEDRRLARRAAPWLESRVCDWATFHARLQELA